MKNTPFIHTSDYHHHELKVANVCAMPQDASVSSILLQENRFSPLSTAGFFLPERQRGRAGIWCTIHHTHWQDYPDRMNSDLSAPPPSSIDWTRTELGDHA